MTPLKARAVHDGACLGELGGVEFHRPFGRNAQPVGTPAGLGRQIAEGECGGHGRLDGGDRGVGHGAQLLAHAQRDPVAHPGGDDGLVGACGRLGEKLERRVDRGDGARRHDDERAVDHGVLKHDLQRLPVALGRGRGAHVDGVHRNLLGGIGGLEVLDRGVAQAVEIDAAGLGGGGGERCEARAVGNDGDAVAAGKTVGRKARDGCGELLEGGNERCSRTLYERCERAFASRVGAHLEAGDAVGGVARAAACLEDDDVLARTGGSEGRVELARTADALDVQGDDARVLVVRIVVDQFRHVDVDGGARRDDARKAELGALRVVEKRRADHARLGDERDVAGTGQVGPVACVDAEPRVHEPEGVGTDQAHAVLVGHQLELREPGRVARVCVFVRRDERVGDAPFARVDERLQNAVGAQGDHRQIDAARHLVDA